MDAATDRGEPAFTFTTKLPQEIGLRLTGEAVIERLFRQYETGQLDPGQALRRVKERGTLSLEAGGKTLELELVTHDMRASDYRAEEVSADGVTSELPRTPISTFRGHLRGRADTEARFTLDGTTVEGLIIIDGEKHFVEPMKRYSKFADRDDYILYQESDVVDHSPVSCGATMDEKLSRAADLIASQASLPTVAADAEFAPLNRDIRLATEADYEFVSQAGGSSAAISQILNIMNLVDGVYQEELGISFSIAYQHTWATPADPYLSTAPQSVFSEFKNYWNSNLTGISRDAAHMWTGKDLDGDVIGIADLGVICRTPSRAYGVSQRQDEVDLKVGITAHEIGHNLGATHPDQEPSPVSSCASSIMQSRVGFSRSFCQFSREQMTSYVNTEAACLPPTYSIAGRVARASFGSPVTLTITGPKHRAAEVSFTGGYVFRGLTAGTYTITPSGQFQIFTPASRLISDLSSNQSGVDFAAELVRFSIAGRVVDGGGSSISGVEMILSTPSNVVSRINTGADGSYVFEGVPATKDYTVSPYSPNGFFTPVSRTITTLTAHQTGIDFTGTLRPSPTPTPTPTPTPPPITGLTGRVAFVSSFQGTSDIYAMDADGSRQVSLTSDSLHDVSPAWSPDGSRLAFIRAGFLHLINPDGSGLRRLTSGNALESNPAWSPDGRKIAFNRTEQLFVVDADGTGDTRVPVAGALEPKWSPDGTKILYRMGYLSDLQIFVMNADGSGQTRLTNAPGGAGGAEWSPDGSKIVFVRGQFPRAEVSLMNPDGSNQVSVTGPGSYFDPAWSPDSSKLVFSNAGAIYVMNRDGSNQTRLTANDRYDADPTWTSMQTSPPTVVRFSADSYQSGEGAGRATALIRREGDTSGVVTVEYQTIDDPTPVRCDFYNSKAYARCDYATTVDTVTFAPGETQKTVAVPLIDDGHAEGFEIIPLQLMGVQGASYGAPSATLLVVLDNDAGQAVNPVISHPFFVRMQYLDFLSREPDQDGLTAWLGVLQGCPDPFNADPSSPAARCDRNVVSSSFFRSEEFQLKGFYVYLFYRAAYGRRPEYAEVIPDMRQVTGQTPAELFQKRAGFAEGFARRAEFTARYGTLSHRQYVDALLGRYDLQQITTEDPEQPDSATQVTLTRQQLVGRLDARMLTRAKVLRALVQSSEVEAADYNGAFVAMQYYGYLRRTPEEAGYQAWLNYLNAHPDDYRTMVNGFMNSQEYRLRFGQP